MTGFLRIIPFIFLTPGVALAQFPADQEVDRSRRFAGRMPALESDVGKVSMNWIENGGVAPRCSDPSRSWARGSRPYDVLSLLSAYRRSDAAYMVEVLQDSTSGTPASAAMDHLSHFYGPHWIDNSLGASSLPMNYGSARLDAFNWGLRWDMQNIDLPWQLDVAAAVFGGTGYNDEIREKASWAYCVDAHGNFRGVTSRDHRRKGDVRRIWDPTDDEESYKGPRTRIRFSPQASTFPLGEVEVIPQDRARAERLADGYYRDPADEEHAYPHLSRWDVIAVPSVTRIPTRVFATWEDYETYISGEREHSKYRDIVTFQILLAGAVRKQTYIDPRFGSARGERGSGGHFSEARFRAERTLLLDGTDTRTRAVIADVTNRAFATGKGFGATMIGAEAESGIGPVRDVVIYENKEYLERIRRGCSIREGYDCEKDNPLAADTLAADPKGLCPTGYSRVEVDARAVAAWDWESAPWSKDVYRRGTGCTSAKCKAAAKTYPGSTRYLCTLRSEAERARLQGGERGQTRTQSSAERIRCRREGTCKSN